MFLPDSLQKYCLTGRYTIRELPVTAFTQVFNKLLFIYRLRSRAGSDGEKMKPRLFLKKNCIKLKHG